MLPPIETIASVLRTVGFSVIVTTRLDDGFPQLVIGADGFLRLAYVRDDENNLTEEEFEFRRTWVGPRILTLKTPDHALGEVGYWMSRAMRERQRQ